MKITVTTDEGREIDVTEAVRVLYDVATSGMDWGSGFLDYEEVTEIRKVGYACGFETISYTLDVCGTCGHRRTDHRTSGTGLACRWGWRTHAVRLPTNETKYGFPTYETIVDEVGCSCPEFWLDETQPSDN